MDLSPRQTQIIGQIRKFGTVQVDDLADVHDVTTQTIRRDLSDLCDRGLAARIHGGARETHSLNNSDYENRRLTSRAQKQAIASLTARLIPENCSVMMNIGTTTEQVAQALRSHHGLKIITNNINIINILINTPDKELILAGGTIRPSDGAVIGTEAVDFISRFKADYAIIGTSAIDADGSILDHDQREVSVARAILQNARVKILVADSAKFNHNASVRICGVPDLDYFITDQMPCKQFLNASNKTTIITPDTRHDPT